MCIILVILIPAALLGLFLARFMPGRAGAWLSALLPAAGLSALLIYDVFYTPYNEADSYDALIGFFIGGGVGAYIGYFFNWLGSRFFSRQ